MVLEAEGVTFGYRADRPVVRAASAAVPAGSVTALVGPNGAGKTTLVRLLLGLRRAHEGRVTVAGEPVDAMSAPLRVRRLVYVPRQSTPAFAFTVREVAAMGCAGPARAARAQRALDAVGLGDRANDVFGVLSAGQQQRATLARGLAQIGDDPRERWLLADEPVASMDPRHALGAMRLLRGLAARGAGVLVVLHDLWLARRFADRAIVLGEGGRVVAEGPVAQTLTPEVLGSVFGVRFLRPTDAGLDHALVPEAAAADMMGLEPPRS